MPRARWLILGALSAATAAVVLLDVTGVIFEPPPQPVPPPPLLFDAPEPVSDAMTSVDPADPAVLAAPAQRALARALSDNALGPAVHALVTTATGSALFAQSPLAPATPASSLKLLTGLSVLDALPADARLQTSVVVGDEPGSIVLVGGGDASLAVDRPAAAAPRVASLAELAQRSRRQLTRSGIERVQLAYDESLFVGPSISPEWEPIYVTSGVIAPVTALMADRALVGEGSLARYPDPAQAAAEDFAALLEDTGIAVKGQVTETAADADADVVAAVESPPIESLIERMLRDSDNQVAESLARVAAAESGFPTSFAGSGQAMAAAAQRYGIAVDADLVFDASGLSRDNQVTVSALGAVLQVAATEDQFRPLVDGLPVAGFDGTLSERFVAPPQSAAAGVVRAKTGTLTGISTESGVAVACDGALVLFSFVADEVSSDTVAARDALDRAAAALTTCG